MPLITIESQVLESINQKLDMLLQQHASNSRHMHESEAMSLTGLGKDTLRTYRRYGVLAKKTIGKKRVYSRKEVNDLIEGKLDHKMFAMREAIKEKKNQQTA